MTLQPYDTIIIGSGPAGLSAAIYAGRYNRTTLLIRGLEPGGNVINAWVVENYPGFEKINGPELIKNMEAQAKKFNAEIVDGEVISLKKNNGTFTIKTDDNEYQSKTVIIATGMKRRELGLPNEKELTGKGVAYCATCDAPFFKGKDVAIVGGGDTSVKAAILLQKYAKETYLITREKELNSEPANIEKLKSLNIPVLYETTVKSLKESNGRLTGIRLSKPFHSQDILALNGLFIEIGGIPNTDLSDQLKVAKDDSSHVIVNWDMSTNVPGVYAAGDVTTAFGHFKQIITAAAQGTVAASSINSYLTKKPNKS